MSRIKLVLVEPEIPSNTGNIIRLCANTGTDLYLIGPLGFHLTNKKMKRAGLDYLEYCNIKFYKSWENFWSSEMPDNSDCYALTTKSVNSIYRLGNNGKGWLFLGPETRGLSDLQKFRFKSQNLLRIPMLEDSRSLNLSNSAAIALYEFLRVSGFNNGNSKLLV